MICHPPGLFSLGASVLFVPRQSAVSKQDKLDSCKDYQQNSLEVPSGCFSHFERLDLLQKRKLRPFCANLL